MLRTSMNPNGLATNGRRMPWQDIAGLRDILIHEYEGVDFTIIWDVAVNEVPILRDAVNSLLGQLGEP